MSHDPFAAASEAEILGLDNVRLDLPLAGLGSRLLAMFIDLLVVALLGLLFLVGLILLSDSLGLSGAWMIAIVLFVLFCLQWGYFSACEIAMEGRTPGKSLVGLRTVSSLGGKPSVGAVLVRNLVRFIDMSVGWPLIALDRRCRRLGDLLASTLVVHHREHDHGVRLARVPTSWSSRDVAVVESFLRRARRMEAFRARDLAERLLDWIRRREPTFLSQHGLDPAGRMLFDDPVGALAELLAAERA